MKKQNDEITVKDLVSIFIPKLWIIVVSAVVLGVLFGGYALVFKKDTYTSRATFMLSRDNSSTISSSDIELSYRVIENLEIVLFSRDFLDSAVAEDINQRYEKDGIRTGFEELKRVFKVVKSGETSVFSIEVTTTSAVKSHIIAKSLVSHLVTAEDGTPAPIKDFLPNAYSKINIKTIESPLPASAKNDKGVVTSAVIGALLGAVVSMVVIFIVNRFDIVVHDRKKLEEYFDFPILGVIPRHDVSISENGGKSA